MISYLTRDGNGDPWPIGFAMPDAYIGQAAIVRHDPTDSAYRLVTFPVMPGSPLVEVRKHRDWAGDCSHVRGLDSAQLCLVCGAPIGEQACEAARRMAARTLAQLCDDFDAAKITHENAEQMPTVRAWLMAEIERRSPVAFMTYQCGAGRGLSDFIRDHYGASLEMMRARRTKAVDA